MINKVFILGNVGKDPEIVNTESGVKIAKFSLATSETYKDKSGEKKVVTEWHNVVSFGKLSDIIESYVKQGSKLHIEGKIKYDKWEDKDGNKRISTSIVASNMTMLDSKPKTEAAPSKPEKEAAPIQQTIEVECDLPF